MINIPGKIELNFRDQKKTLENVLSWDIVRELIFVHTDVRSEDERTTDLLSPKKPVFVMQVHAR